MKVDTIAVADCKDHARLFVSTNFPEVKHIFTDCRDLSGDVEKCCCCAGRCKFDRSHQPSLATAGLPCQPFTGMRTTTGTGKNSGPPRKHKLYETYREFQMYLTTRQPHGFVVEEVTRILSVDHESGKRWLDLFLADAEHAGYKCSAIKLSADPWTEVPPDRHGQS